MVKILLVGQGAREHIIAETLCKNSAVELHSYMKTNNPGIVSLSHEVVLGDINDGEVIALYAKEKGIDFAFVGPEAPLGAGVVDSLEAVGVPSVGPKKALAQLETSKQFTRNLVEKYDISGNPQYKTFTSDSSDEEIKGFLETLGGEFVIKADGLKGGKGVKVSGDHLDGVDDGLAYAKECIESDGSVVVEEKFVGEEFSLMCFCDGRTVVKMPAVQDHKRAYVDDKGPNTGGMGSYSDANHLLPFLTKSDVEAALAITQDVCDALRKECGAEYKGIMYGGFMTTAHGVKLVEYNARFGDPEVMNLLTLLETDFVSVCQAIVDGTLSDLDVVFSQKATVCKYAVPEGYPDNPVKGEKVDVSGVGDDVTMYYASVDQREDGLFMTGSRAIGFVGVADTLSGAEAAAERGVCAVKGPVFHREDIGTLELVQKRVDHMKTLRG